MEKLLDQIDKLQNEINLQRPLQKHETKQIKEYFRIGLAYTSNALEGNSLTETETKIILEEGITIGGKPLKDHLEAVGHSDAYDFIYECSTKTNITENMIKKLHRLFFYRIDEKWAGKYREVKAYITGSKYPLPNPEQVPSLMSDFVNNLEAHNKVHPIVRAIQAHKDFVFIHPFIDGNGRVARLLANLMLLQQGYLPMIIPPVCRSEYIATLEKAHKNDTDFVNFILEMLKETQKDYLRLFG